MELGVRLHALSQPFYPERAQPPRACAGPARGLGPCADVSSRRRARDSISSSPILASLHPTNLLPGNPPSPCLLRCTRESGGNVLETVTAGGQRRGVSSQAPWRRWRGRGCREGSKAAGRGPAGGQRETLPRLAPLGLSPQPDPLPTHPPNNLLGPRAWTQGLGVPQFPLCRAAVLSGWERVRAMAQRGSPCGPQHFQEQSLRVWRRLYHWVGPQTDKQEKNGARDREKTG